MLDPVHYTVHDSGLAAKCAVEQRVVLTGSNRFP
jgi:hypothetical protein